MGWAATRVTPTHTVLALLTAVLSESGLNTISSTVTCTVVTANPVADHRNVETPCVGRSL